MGQPPNSVLLGPDEKGFNSCTAYVAPHMLFGVQAFSEISIPTSSLTPSPNQADCVTKQEKQSFLQPSLEDSDLINSRKQAIDSNKPLSEVIASNPNSILEPKQSITYWVDKNGDYDASMPDGSFISLPPVEIDASTTPPKPLHDSRDDSVSQTSAKMGEKTRLIAESHVWVDDSSSLNHVLPYRRCGHVSIYWASQWGQLSPSGLFTSNKAEDSVCSYENQSTPDDFINLSSPPINRSLKGDWGVRSLHRSAMEGRTNCLWDLSLDGSDYQGHRSFSGDQPPILLSNSQSPISWDQVTNSLEFFGFVSHELGVNQLQLGISLDDDQLLALVDSRATHNLIFQQLVSPLGCLVGVNLQLGDVYSLWIDHHDFHLSLVLKLYACLVKASMFSTGQLDVNGWECFIQKGQSIFLQDLPSPRPTSTTLYDWVFLYANSEVIMVYFAYSILDLLQGWSNDNLSAFHYLLGSLGAVARELLSNLKQISAATFCRFFLILKKMGAMVYTLVYVWVDFKGTNLLLFPPALDSMIATQVLHAKRGVSRYLQPGTMGQRLLQWKDKPPDTSLEVKTFSKAGVMIGNVIIRHEILEGAMRVIREISLLVG